MDDERTDSKDPNVYIMIQINVMNGTLKERFCQFKNKVIWRGLLMARMVGGTSVRM